MKPVKPTLRYIPNRVSPPQEVTWAENQTEYNPLPAIIHGDTTTSRWEFSFLERLHVLFFGFIFISQMNFGDKLQPILPSTEQPEPWK